MDEAQTDNQSTPAQDAAPHPIPQQGGLYEFVNGQMVAIEGGAPPDEAAVAAESVATPGEAS